MLISIGSGRLEAFCSAFDFNNFGEAHAFSYWRFDGSGQGIPLPSHRKKGSGAAFNPDAKWLASAASDTTVRLWRLSDG